ncbi:hypothetical protein LJR230_002980 [Trinickia sp. LjRoot230]|uniref:hypothetical protein n=1 Tax=Trinickia sp. LjRoot230 TaxID=3342288 RepID=UPI003ECDAA87
MDKALKIQKKSESKQSEAKHARKMGGTSCHFVIAAYFTGFDLAGNSAEAPTNAAG